MKNVKGTRLGSSTADGSVVNSSAVKPEGGAARHQDGSREGLWDLLYVRVMCRLVVVECECVANHESVPVVLYTMFWSWQLKP